MFAGLVGLERHSHSSVLHRGEATQGASGRASGSVGSASRKRLLLHKRPGFTKGERRQDGVLLNCSHGDDDDDADDEGRGALTNGKSTNDATSHSKNSVNEAHKHPSCSSHVDFSATATSPMNCNHELVISKPEVVRTIPKSQTFPTSFSSSFSFIQQSLNSSSGLHRFDPDASDVPCGEVREEFWADGLWSSGSGRTRGSELPDVDARSVDTEVTSSLSVDSDSASSVTSGYESGTQVSAAEQGLLKKYEQQLQESLRNNRAHTKIQSMMLKLQRLQQKAVQDDDYDAAERFGKKLEELCLERSSLTLGLPSRLPPVESFLQRLSAVVNSALHRPDSAAQHSEIADSDGADQGPLQRRDRLIQEKRLVELEMSELQQRLSELERRRRSLDRQIQSQEQEAESEDLETSVLKTYSASQIQDLSQTVQDLLSSQERRHITASPPPAVLRLQEQEQALNLSIKEATAKVVMTQRLGSNLRRKVSETETQLVALHEAKLAAISGNDFCSAKQLKAEMKAVHQERERLEALTRRLRTLSSSSCEDVNALKQQRQRLRRELEDEQTQHESRLKDNASKYAELLEDTLHSDGCPGLERIWEADLEACHLFLRGLQLRAPSVSGSNGALPLTSDLSTHDPARPKAEKEEEQDCAMLTALGGRWCPEANLQNSQFTKKLEEFLFCVEDNGAEDGISESGAADLTEQCELISDRLMTLEEELQMAIHNRDQELTQSLEKEVQNVKATLQSMLARLQTDEEEEEDDDVVKLEDDDLMENGPEGEEDEEEEDEYFSDSWDI